MLFNFKCRGRQCTMDDKPYLAGWKCKPCPPGKFLSSTSNGPSLCKACPADSLSSGKLRTSCVKCENGVQRDKDNPYICSCKGETFIGKGASENGVRCVTCKPGTYSDASMAVCELCPPGTFSFREGRARCVQCPPGKYAPKAGLRVCWKCPEGTIGDRGAQAKGSTMCVKKSV